MGKVAWFITHDSYIDRRIFFFVECMKTRGYSVKLFPACYFDVLAAKDYSYVQRPWQRKVIKEYNVPRSNLSSKLRKKISSIESKEVDKRYEHIKCIKRNIFGGGIYFNSSKNNITIVHRHDNAANVRKCEEAIVSFSRSENSVDNKNNYEGVQLIHFINDDFEECFFIQAKGSYRLYEYNLQKELLSEIVPLDRNLTGSIKHKNKKFKDFISTIYDYQDTLARLQADFLKEKPDIVYVADLPTLPIGIILKELSGCKLIMDCHEWWYKQTILWEPHSRKKIDLVDRYEKELYPKCDVCITVGTHLANRMKAHIGCEFATIYSCINKSFLPSIDIDKSFLRVKYNLSDDTKILIFQGGMSSHRNLENLARMTKYFDKDVVLLLLTCGEYQDVFRKVLNKEGNPERVIWGGWIDQSELLNYTKNADLGIIPYVAVNDYAECFVPNKLMEYYSIRLPIVFDPSIRELDMVIGGNGVGYGTDLTRPKEAGNNINKLIHDEDKLAEYRDNYSKCYNNFTYESQKKIYDELVERIEVN